MRSGSGYLDPAASPRLLVVVAQLPLREFVEIAGQGAATTTACVPGTLVRLTAEVRVHFTADEDAEVVLMPVLAAHLRSHPMLATSVVGSHDVTSSWCRRATGWSASG
jgi:hypothetical protein